MTRNRKTFQVLNADLASGRQRKMKSKNKKKKKKKKKKRRRSDSDHKMKTKKSVGPVIKSSSTSVEVITYTIPFLVVNSFA